MNAATSTGHDAPVLLIVEDDTTLRDMLVTLFASEGFVVLEAGTVREGLAKLLERQISAILLDIMLPEIDGFQACHIIKHSPDKRNIPIVVISALTERRHITKAQLLGAEAYVCKPFDTVNLVATVRKAIAESSTARTSS